MDFNQAVSYLESIEYGKYNLDLGNISMLLKSLENPHRKFNSIHVGGSNGKGSTCAMITSILRSAGHTVGTYTSPHLVSIRERIALNGQNISQEDFARILTTVLPNAKTHTYFEILTAAAFAYFAEKRVDYVIAEVGMGGRLDATNVLVPLVSVITNISLEHTEYLGDSLEKIAYEKAGIIKQGVPVVTAAGSVALEILKDLSEQSCSKLHHVEELDGYELGLHGKFQLINAAMAAKVAEILGIPQNAVRDGLKNARWPGRMQFIEKNILLDCAHNPDGAKELAKSLKGKRIVLIFGALKDKDHKGMLSYLDPLASIIIFTKPSSPRSVEPEDLLALVPGPSRIIPNPDEALAIAKEIAQDCLIVIAGSIYLAGDILKLYPESF